MIIIDTALQKRLAQGNPVRVALVAAGYMGRGIALEILRAFPGIRLAVIVNRTVDQAERAYREAGASEFRPVASPAELDKAIADGAYAVTDDPTVACRARGIEAVIETSGDVEYGSLVALEALKNGKHVILMNAETDAAVGPILKVYADRSGVVYTYTDGDEPGVAMNLFRFVDSIGYKPVMLGQIKGFLNRYRNPDTQKEFAARHNQKPSMVASFADGSKLALESAIIGNATGFKPAKLGMHGHECKHVKDLLNHFKPEDFANGGFVDFVLGAEPHTGAFVMGYNDDPVLRAVHGLLQVRRRAALHVLHAVSPAAPATAAFCRSRGPVPGPDAHAARRAGLRGGGLREAGPPVRRVAGRHGRLHELRSRGQLREQHDARLPAHVAVGRLHAEARSGQGPAAALCGRHAAQGARLRRPAGGAGRAFRPVGARTRRGVALSGGWEHPPARPSLGASETHVWAFDADASESAAAGMRAILARYTGLAPEALRFERAELGKPSLATSGDCPGLRFNTSASGSLALLALRRGHEVGIDVEAIHELPDGIAQRAMTAVERAAFDSLPAAHRAARFTALWVAKEAAAKCLGRGLRQPFDRIELASPAADVPQCVRVTCDGGSVALWLMPIPAPRAGHAAALAATVPVGELRLWSLLESPGG